MTETNPRCCGESNHAIPELHALDQGSTARSSRIGLCHGWAADRAGAGSRISVHRQRNLQAQRCCNVHKGRRRILHSRYGARTCGWVQGPGPCEGSIDLGEIFCYFFNGLKLTITVGSPCDQSLCRKQSEDDWSALAPLQRCLSSPKMTGL